MAGAGQIQGGSIWKKTCWEENLNIQIVPGMGKNKAKFLNFKHKVCPVARRSFAVLLWSLRSKVENFYKVGIWLHNELPCAAV